MPPMIIPKNGAESVLLALKQTGIDYLFANAGTDFPSIIEALASLPESSVPKAITVSHETAAIGMAHGYFLVTGRPQAVMVHVNVGLANTAMGVINAASDNIPMLVLSGRTSITQKGRAGSRAYYVQYGQEMYDQTSLVRDAVKYSYEMRYPEQGGPLVHRAMAVATQFPQGPAYLSLPCEPLAETIPDGAAAAHGQPETGEVQACAHQIESLADWIRAAARPLILVQRSDPDFALAGILADFARDYGMTVVEPYFVRNVLASDHPCLMGYDATEELARADLVLVIDCDIPWIELNQSPHPDARIVHLGSDPIFARMPFRDYPSDMNVAGSACQVLRSLRRQLGKPDKAMRNRHDDLSKRSGQAREARVRKTRSQNRGGITAEWLSHCVSGIMQENSVAFTELGLLPGFMHLTGANRLFSNTHAGGLGWALPAALGASLADKSRLVVACMGDGSYIFSNPVACHHMATALDLPLLTIVSNNGMWNTVRRSVIERIPDGKARSLNTIPLTSLKPVPDFTKTAQASDAFSLRVEQAEDLQGALQEAVEIVTGQKRQALLDVITIPSDV